MSATEVLEIIRTGRCPKCGDGSPCDVRAIADVTVAVEVRGDRPEGVVRVSAAQEILRGVDDTLRQPEFYSQFEWGAIRCAIHGWSREE